MEVTQTNSNVIGDRKIWDMGQNEMLVLNKDAYKNDQVMKKFKVEHVNGMCYYFPVIPGIDDNMYGMGLSTNNMRPQAPHSYSPRGETQFNGYGNIFPGTGKQNMPITSSGGFNNGSVKCAQTKQLPPPSPGQGKRVVVTDGAAKILRSKKPTRTAAPWEEWADHINDNTLNLRVPRSPTCLSAQVKIAAHSTAMWGGNISSIKHGDNSPGTGMQNKPTLDSSNIYGDNRDMRINASNINGEVTEIGNSSPNIYTIPPVAHDTAPMGECNIKGYGNIAPGTGKQYKKVRIRSQGQGGGNWGPGGNTVKQRVPRPSPGTIVEGKKVEDKKWVPHTVRSIKPHRYAVPGGGGGRFPKWYNV